MRISEYELIESSYGSGYIDDPYEFFNLYVRGDTSISWTVVGSGKFAVNLSDMYQRVYDKDVAYHVISIYVNGVLTKVDNSMLTETKDFGLIMDLTEDVSEIALVFNSNLNRTENLTYIKKLSSFLLEKKPNGAIATTTIEPSRVLTDNEEIKANGVRIASVDFGSVCGAYRVEITPNTGEFHLIDGEIWFTGERSTEREYRIFVNALDMNDVIISSKSLSLTLADCNSSSACVIGEGNAPTTPDGSVDETLAIPSNTSVVIDGCGPKESEADSDNPVIWSLFTISWSQNGEELFDVLVSRSSAFNLVDVEYYSISQNNVELLLLSNTRYFFKVRSRSQESSSVSEWSDVLIFETETSTDCNTPLPPPEVPESVPVICRDRVPPAGPEETPNPTPPTTPPEVPEVPELPEPEPEPEPNPKPENPTPPTGPDECFGSGCGDNSPDNPDNPTPNPPASTSPNPNSPGGCIGPGCSPGSEPQPPGTGEGEGGGSGGENPGPGGEDGPSTNPPQVPLPSAPTCNGVIVQTIFRGWILNGSPTSPCEVEIKWSDRGEDCDTYLARIGVASGGLVLPPFGLSEFSTEGNPTVQDLKFTCPNCVEVCVKGNAVQISWELVSQAFDSEGNPDGEPYVSASATQMALDTCNCEDATDISPWLTNPDPIERDGITYTYSQQVTNIGLETANYALHKALPPNVFAVTTTLKAQGDQSSQATDSQHVKRKMVVVKCEDEVWQDVTEEYIGCEVVFHSSFVGDLNVDNKFATYKDSWLMSSATHEYCQDSRANWPLMGCLDILEFSNSKPFGSNNWDLESPLCVTCCEQGTSSSWQDQQPMEMSSTQNVTHGNRLASTRGDYNNVNCLDGQIKDPNLNGRTAKTGNRPFNRTIVDPCSLPVANVIIEDQYGVANLHYTTGNTYYVEPTQVGTPPAWPGCTDQGEVCRKWINNSIATEYSTINNVCSPDVQVGNRWQLYTLTPAVLDANIYTRKVTFQCPGGDASNTDRYSVSTNRGNNAPIPQVISNLETNPPIQNNNTGNWTKDSIGNDGYRVGAARYKWTTWGAGVVMSDGPANPLP